MLSVGPIRIFIGAGRWWELCLPTRHALYEQSGAESADSHGTELHPAPSGSRTGHRWVAVRCRWAVKCPHLKVQTIPNFGRWPLFSASGSVQFADSPYFFFSGEWFLILLKIAKHCPLGCFFFNMASLQEAVLMWSKVLMKTVCNFKIMIHSQKFGENYISSRVLLFFFQSGLPKM